MPFSYKDIKRAHPFMKKFIEGTQKDPDMEFTLDCTSGADIKILEGCPDKPGIGFTASCGVLFYHLYNRDSGYLQSLLLYPFPF